MQLFQDQETCIAGLRGAFAADYHSPLLVSPTGSGKTVMFSYLAAKLLAAGQRVAILVHRDELVDQVSGTLDRFDVPHGRITAGMLYDRRLKAHVASVFTLARRITKVAVPDYVICDEAHHATAASTWGKIIAYWREENPKLRLIGVTATPQRLDGSGLGETFDTMVLGPTTRWLIDNDRLSPYRLFAPQVQVDLTGVGTVAGDFKRGACAAALDKPAITGSAVNEYRKLMDGAPAVAFCVSLEHAAHVTEQFRSAGFRAVGIDGTMEKAMRREIVRDFGRGAISVLVSCDIISEGFDVPGIVGAILLRPTQSLALNLQQVGRALRKAPGKAAAIILDHVNNSGRHGMPDDPRDWSLMSRARAKKDGDNAACRTCPTCFAVSAAAAKFCRECKAPFPVNARVVEEREGVLAEVDVMNARKSETLAAAAAESIEGLEDLARRRGYKNPGAWARAVFMGEKRMRSA